MSLQGTLAGLPITSTHTRIRDILVPLLDLAATHLLEHLGNVIESEFHTVTDSQGRVWYRQNFDELRRRTRLSERKFRSAKDLLMRFGIVQMKKLAGPDRTAHWRIQEPVLARLIQFAEAFDVAYMGGKDISIWWNFVLENPEIVDEFRPLYPRLHDFDPPEDYKAPRSQKKPKHDDSCVQPKKASAKPRLNAKKRHSEEGAKASKPEPVPDRFVEHWNAQEGVPKCKLGTKAYEACREFFKAHSHYAAGTSKNCMLDAAERERIKLHKINRVPPDAERKGTKKLQVRPDSQMLRHIEKAAKMYSPQYWPPDKTRLPKSLAAFLYNPFSAKYGQNSRFLECLCIRQPQLLENYTREDMWARATEFERDTYYVFRKWFNLMNDHDEDAELSLKDHKQALSIARDYVDHYRRHFADTIFDGVSMRSYEDFLDHFRWIVSDLVWDEMPLGAFRVGNRIWQRFVGENDSDDE